VAVNSGAGVVVFLIVRHAPHRVVGIGRADMRAGLDLRQVAVGGVDVGLLGVSGERLPTSASTFSRSRIAGLIREGRHSCL
jgi:hypothetical protein